MASSDMIALILQMMKQMQEQQHAADERQRQFMAAILERRADQTPTAIRPTIKKSPTIKIDFKEFSGELEDWTTRSKVHRAQLSALGCADALTETAGDETKVTTTISIAAAPTRTDYTKRDKPGFHWSPRARESRSTS